MKERFVTDMKGTALLLSFFTGMAMGAFAYNPYAPNSFDSVSPKSRDYQTVYLLTGEGKAPAYTPDFFRRGNLTRYELAGIIKNMLENHDPKDKDYGDLMRLKKEYARELDALGYREKKKQPSGNPVMEFSGDGRIRYNDRGEADGRVRVNTTWHIDQATTINASGKKDIE